MFNKVVTFFHDHPGFKTGLVAVLGAILTLAAQGTFGPKGAVIAASISSVVALYTKRPQDGSGQ
jgi:hypothetical protein